MHLHLHVSAINSMSAERTFYCVHTVHAVLRKKNI